MREFDLTKQAFVTDGFKLPLAKTNVAWRDRDSILVGTDFGPGSITHSGYPRLVKEWRRGTPLTQAVTVYEGKATDVDVAGMKFFEPRYERELIVRRPTYHTREYHLREGQELVRLDLPREVLVSLFRDQLLVRLRSDWRIGPHQYPAGALISIRLDAYLEGERDFDTLFVPTARKALASYTVTRNHVILNESENVRNRVYAMSHSDGRWQRRPLAVPQLGSARVEAVDPLSSDEYFLMSSDLLTPASLDLGRIGGARERLKQQPALFDGTSLAITQHDAISKDGTRIPYFQSAASISSWTAASQHYSMVTAASRSRERQITTQPWARHGSSRAACTSSPIYAAAASSDRAGIRLRSGRTASGPTTTSSPWPRTSSVAR